MPLTASMISACSFLGNSILVIHLQTRLNNPAQTNCNPTVLMPETQEGSRHPQPHTTRDGYRAINGAFITAEETSQSRLPKLPQTPNCPPSPSKPQRSLLSNLRPLQPHPALPLPLLAQQLRRPQRPKPQHPNRHHTPRIRLRQGPAVLTRHTASYPHRYGCRPLARYIRQHRLLLLDVVADYGAWDSR